MDGHKINQSFYIDGIVFFRTVAVILCYCIPASTPQDTPGPQDITRKEGDTDVFIPCPFNDLEIPFWKINGTFYSATQLQYPFLSLSGDSNNQSGIVILLIHRSLNGTTFQCLVAPGVGSDPTPLKSTQIVLTVLYNPEQGKDLVICYYTGWQE